MATVKQETAKQELEMENSLLRRRLDEAVDQLKEKQTKLLALEEDFLRAIKFMHRESA